MEERSTPHDVRLLGPLEVRSANGVVELGGPRQRALFGLLALNANRVVPRERIVDALWGDRPPPTAANALQVAVHAIRKAIGANHVLTQGSGYRLVLEAGELDLDSFGRLVERSRAEPAREAAETLREALALHRGALLADLSDVPFVPAERERIEEQRLAALERRIDADLELGRHAELVGELEGLVAAHPYRERLRAQLMLALYRSGRQADALDQYRLAREALAEELGLDPSRELHELQAAILRQDAALDPPRTGQPVRSQLPHPAGRLIGRELELAAVAALVRTPERRLVTLTGPGGTGKTRLALEAAWVLSEEVAGGAHFVDLAPLTDATLVAPAVARALGVRDAAADELLDRVAAAVGERETLVVLDNVEHLLEAAPAVADLLAHAGPLRVLATSREPLRIRAEQEYRVPPLRLPDREAAAGMDVAARSEAVAFFVERAQAIRPGFEPAGNDVAAIVGICRALDGLPLALELAAARLKLLSPAALLDRLEDRLGALGSGDRDLPERQRTLRATIEWSYGLLSSDERTLLARLAVFSGGWTIEAAEAVADADLSALGSLADKNLVRADTLPTGETRFTMLETVREYALERLTASRELDATRDRHAAYFGDLAERLEPVIESAAAVDEVDREHDNIRQALEHTLSKADGDAALRLCAIARFWYARGYLGEGSAWLERALAVGGGSPVRRAQVLYVAAAIDWSSGDYERAIVRGDEALGLAREVDDVRAEIGALTALGLAHLGTRDLEASREYHRRALDAARAGGHDRWTGIALANIADLEVMLGNHVEADELVRESLEIHRRSGDVEATGMALLVRASSLLERDRPADALPMIVESIGCFRRMDFKDFLASALVALARAKARDDPGQAGRLLGAAQTMRSPLGPSHFPWERDWFERADEVVRDLVGSSRADAELSAGASAPEAVVDEVLAEASATGRAS